MVRKKPSRAVANVRAKPLKPNVTITEEEEADTKESLKKRLDDFDMQVKEVLIKMEADKQAVVDSIKHLYFVDQQRTSPEINNMLWIKYLNQNTIAPRSEIRESIAQLIISAEESNLKRTAKKRKIANVPVDNFTAPGNARSTRGRPALSSRNSEYSTDTPLTKNQTSKGKKAQVVECTPANQKIPAIPKHLLITPKFDPRTPLPPNTLRKPKFGEIAVSLKGSPLQVGAKDLELDSLKDHDLDEKTREELQDLHEKVSQLLQI